MTLSDYHIHSTYCDGRDKPEDIVLEAMARGLEEVGICTHSYTSFDESYCIKREDIAIFQNEINGLKKKYADKIKVFCGVEQDYFSDAPTDGFDYVIGSVHYVKAYGDYLPVDCSKELTEKNVKKYFGGDYLKFAEEYFKLVSEVVDKVDPDIIGHFDLISKFNENESLFNENDEKYIKIWMSALDALLVKNIPFEVNTGAVSRGYKTSPYPSVPMIEYILKNNGKLILSSDSHSKSNICFGFDGFEIKSIIPKLSPLLK